MNKCLIALSLAVSASALCGPNQTDSWTPIQAPDSLPYKITIQQADFQLPSSAEETNGLQTYVFAVYHGKWLLLAGRTNGLHGFNPGNDNFPPLLQNTTVYVVDPDKKTVATRSLTDPASQLTQTQIDSLSVTAAQNFQRDRTLYVVGGYGVDTPTGQFSTKSTLTAIDIPGLMHWVENPSSSASAAQSIRQTSHPLLQVTGGYLTQNDPHQPFLLIFGQNFSGFYSSGSNGAYTQQVQPFKIIDDGVNLYVQPYKQFSQNPAYRRRDLNVAPIIRKGATSLESAYVALSGVFTEDSGIWTVPVLINADGSSSMADPSSPTTFMQGMNNYISAHTELYSKKTNEMFILLFGGLTYIVPSGGSFTPDEEIPFNNSVTTVRIDAQGNFAQFLMENEYPVIDSQFTMSPTPLFFGTSSRFLPAKNLPSFSNGVFSLDKLGNAPVLLGYIVGGIESTVQNTNNPSTETAASPYIFSVILEKR